MTSARDPFGLNRERLDRLGYRLRRLTKNLGLLERDATAFNGAWDSVRYCLDFADLHRYLHLHETSSERIDQERQSAEDYVNVLLFRRLGKPFILLPGYYREFSRSLKRLLGDRSGGSERSKVSAISEAIRADHEGLFAYLETVGVGESQIDSTRVFDLAKQLMKTLGAGLKQMKSVSRGLAISARFDYLVKSGCILGLPDVLPQGRSLHIAGSDLYLFSRDRFNEMRPDAATETNEVDAACLAAIGELNRTRWPQPTRFHLVSLASVVATVAAELNEEVLANTGERIEVRDREFWSLWFATARREGRHVPSLAAVDRLVQAVEPIVRELESQHRHLAHRLNGPEVVPASISDSVRVLTNRLDAALLALTRPLLDTEWSLAMVEDAVIGDSQSEPAVKLIEKAQRLLMALAERPDQLASILRELRGVLDQLQHLFARLEAASEAAVAVTHRADSHFNGWVLNSRDLSDQSVKLLELLERNGGEAVKAVLEELAEHTLGEGAIEERHLIMARVYLIEGRLSEAAADLEPLLSKKVSRTPNVLLTQAMLLDSQGAFAGAQAALEEIGDGSDNARLHLMFALVNWHRAGAEGDTTYRAKALGHARMAHDLARHEPARIQLEALLVRIGIELETHSEGPDVPWQARTRAELKAALDAALLSGIPAEVSGRAWELIGRLDG
jgi:hypothetical protein